MKQLHLLRHAKSSWDNPQLTDRERGLNKRGIREAPLMGGALSKRMRPMVIHASCARRAQLTLEGLCTGWPALANLSHVSDEALYTFDAEELVDWLIRRAVGENAVFLLGHNPALTDLVNRLVGRHCLDNLPTAGYAELSLPIASWRDLPHSKAVLEYTLFPRELRNS